MTALYLNRPEGIGVRDSVIVLVVDKSFLLFYSFGGRISAWAGV